MKKLLYDWKGETKLGEVDAEPECGRDFCDKCGDCLACYDGDYCPGGKTTAHMWVEYQDVSSSLLD